MLVIHWAPQNRTSRILNTGIAPSRKRTRSGFVVVQPAPDGSTFNHTDFELTLPHRVAPARIIRVITDRPKRKRTERVA